MKALVCDSYGSLDCVQYRDVPDPLPGPEDLLVKVRGAGCVFTDTLFAEGKYQIKPPLPFVLGSELAGEVIAIGANVTRFQVGERIMSLAPNFGAFAEQVVLPAWIPTRLPSCMSFEEGAGLVSSTATAQHALRQRGSLQPGETLVVTGGAGATGSVAIQVGKILGAKVIAICSSAERAAFCRSLGADETINYAEEDISAGIKARTDHRGADVIMEMVGGDVFDGCVRAMARNGRLLVVGFASGRIPVLPVNLPLIKMYSVIGVHLLTFILQEPDRHAANMEELVSWLERGNMRPPIDSVVPLADGASALRRIAGRKVLGKIILAP